MRRAIGVAAVAVLLALQGCGSREEATSAAPDDATTATIDGDYVDMASADAAADAVEPPATPDRGPASAGTPPPAPAPQERIDCEVIGGLATPGDCDLFTQAALRADEGLGAFNAPDPMYRGEEVMLQLAVSPATAASNVTTPEQTVAQLPGRPVIFTPIVGRRMRAELTGVGFDIVAKSEKSQIVSDRAPTVWNWAVTARKAQRHTLTLTTGVEATGADGQTQVLIPTTKSVSVNVKVAWWARIQEMLEPIPDTIKAVTAILVALAALIGAIYGVRKALRGGTGGGAPADPPVGP